MGQPPLQYKPDYAVLPGDTIRETLAANNQTIVGLANAIGVSVDYMVDVIEARLPITEDLAEKLEIFFKIPAKFWLNRQDHYDETIYRLFWERCRKKPNLFAHFTDDQLEAMQVLLQGADYNEMAEGLIDIIDTLGKEFAEEFKRRFFPNLDI